jgi:AcrR family transcriptional regulator
MAPRARPPDRPGDDLSRSQRRRERSRDEILDAARTVLEARGLQGLTMDEVARAVGLTKPALYYYFPSKDALLGELHHRSFAQMSQRLHDAVEATAAGPEALRALIRETVTQYAPRMNDFRLAFLQPQLAADALHATPEQLARIRPLNDLAFAGAAARVQADHAGRAGVHPRLLAFLAHLAALGVLTMKGLVETFDDPLRYTDEELIDALARVFEAAARP